KPLRVSSVTQLGLCNSMNERMRFYAVGQHAHFIAGKASRPRANKRIEEPEFASLAFGQKPLHPLGREARAVAKPAVDRQPHVVEKVGRVANDIQRGTNLFGLLVGIKQVEHGLLVVLAETEQ